MFVIVTQFMCMAVAAIAGIGFGWWLRGGPARMTACDGPNDAGTRDDDALDRTGEILARLHEVATRMASDVGEHSSRVQEINAELAASGKGQTEAVVRAVAKLFEANQKMQRQLESAEDRLQEQARRMESYAAEARTDPLTKLPNRRALDAEVARRLAEFQRTGRPFSMVMIDVDHFKRFNDTYGHQAGDEVLQGVADVLRRYATGSDMAARYGGEEFVIVLSAAPIAETEARVERIREAIGARRFQFAGEEVHVTASLGLAELLAGESAAELAERADAALYAAKGDGRNCAFRHDGQAMHRIRCRESDPPARTATAESQTSQPVEETQAVRPAEPVGLPEGPRRTPPQTRGSGGPDLPTRMAFCTILRHRIAEWQRGGAAPAVVLVQIDGFAELLAAHGGRVRNVVLDAMARHLRASTREMDIVANYGEAAFALLLPGAGVVSAITVAERIRQTVADSRLTADGEEVRFTVSFGGAEADPSDDTTRLLRRSEESLLASSKSGGNCGYFHNGQWCEMAEAVLQRLQAG